MSSLKCAFILYLFLTTFNVFSADDCTEGNTGGRGSSSLETAVETQADCDSLSGCEQQLEIKQEEYKNYNISECQCEVDTTKKEITDCFEIAACKRDCVNDVSQRGSVVERCNDIRNYSDAFCKEKCARNVAFNMDTIQKTSEFTDCIRDQERELQAECGTHIANIKGPKGAQLVCENGCESFCGERVGQMMSSDYCGNHIANSAGFENCNTAIRNKLAQELSSSPLPPGLSWQKCAYGMPCAAEIKMAFNQAEQECNNLKSKATICCEDPLKCAEAGSSDLFKSSGAVAGGITENCKQIQEKLNNIGSVTQQMADKCKSTASSCVQVCTQQISENFLAVFDKYCNFDLTTEQTYDRDKHTCEGSLVSDYVREYQNTLASIPGQCELVGQKSEQLKQSAEEVLRSSASGQKCAEQASVGTSESEPSPQAPTQMAVLGPESPSVKASAPNNSLRWNPGKGEKVKENIISGASGGSSKKASRRASKNQVQRANVGERKAPPPPAKKKKGFLSRLLSAFGGSKKDKEKQKEGATVSGGPQAASSSNNANVGGGGRDIAKAQKDLAEKDKTKEDKKTKEYASRKFTKAGTKKDPTKKVGSVLDRGITPRDISSVKLGKYGSPHDNIFERLSHRIITLCRQKRINDCQL